VLRHLAAGITRIICKLNDDLVTGSRERTTAQIFAPLSGPTAVSTNIAYFLLRIELLARTR